MATDDSSKNGAPSPLQIDIANQLIVMIRSGEVRPGQRLGEQALAQRFGVSRSPVRAALQLLVARGYLRVRKHAGVTVRSPLPRRGDSKLAGESRTVEDLYRAILSDRADGSLGNVVLESDLVLRYDVTRSLLLRALLRMTREGLVTRRKGHGWTFPSAFDSAEAKYEGYRFRIIVECGGLREPTFAVDPVALASTRQAHEEFLRLPRKDQTPTAFFEMNSQFHELLATFSGNRFVVQAVSLHNRLRRLEEYRRHAVGPNLNDSVRSCKEHLAIIEALEAGDAYWASLLMYHHLMVASRF